MIDLICICIQDESRDWINCPVHGPALTARAEHLKTVPDTIIVTLPTHLLKSIFDRWGVSCSNELNIDDEMYYPCGECEECRVMKVIK